MAFVSRACLYWSRQLGSGEVEMELSSLHIWIMVNMNPCFRAHTAAAFWWEGRHIADGISGDERLFPGKVIWLVLRKRKLQKGRFFWWQRRQKATFCGLLFFLFCWVSVTDLDRSVMNLSTGAEACSFRFLHKTSSTHPILCRHLFQLFLFGSQRLNSWFEWVAAAAETTAKPLSRLDPTYLLMWWQVAENDATVRTRRLEEWMNGGWVISAATSTRRSTHVPWSPHWLPLLLVIDDSNSCNEASWSDSGKWLDDSLFGILRGCYVGFIYLLAYRPYIAYAIHLDRFQLQA